MKVINETEFKQAVEGYNGMVLVDFFASWCGPCRMLSPILEEVGEEIDIPIYKIDVDECEDLARRFGILSIPTMIIFKNGEQVEKINGLRSKQEILETLHNFSNK